MALYAISDLHLPLGVHKPMDIFGKRWEGYVDKLKENWCLTNEDTIVLGGDFSWATYLEESFLDFSFLSELPGHKILLKGNHDYWWTTASKLGKFIEENHFSNISFLYNNSFHDSGINICGTKGFPCQNLTELNEQDKKIYNREAGRFLLSIEHAKKQPDGELVAFSHYMPQEGSAFIEMMKEFGIMRCFYGHLHGETSDYHREHYIDGIRMELMSCDFLNFTPLRISK